MAYSPIEQGELLRHRVLRSIGTRHEATSAQIALAWVLRQDNICAIPRATRPPMLGRTAERSTFAYGLLT